MSQILSEHAKEVIYKKVKRRLGVKCDICKRELMISDPDRGRYAGGVYPEYFIVTTGHNDWGNDSWESRKEQDICPDCIDKFVSDYLSDKKGYKSRYIEIEMYHAYPGDVKVEV